MTFMIKTLNKVSIEGILNKTIAVKPLADFIFKGEKLKALPLKSGTSQGCTFSPFLFNIV